MLKLFYTNKFKKDYKIMQKRGLNMNLIDDIIRKLSREEQLPEENKDHSLQGEYKRIQRMPYTTGLALDL